jgi:hypothetical protein
VIADSTSSFSNIKINKKVYITPVVADSVSSFSNIKINKKVYITPVVADSTSSFSNTKLIKKFVDRLEGLSRQQRRINDGWLY